jgi:hypothetical protein
MAEATVEYRTRLTFTGREAELIVLSQPVTTNTVTSSFNTVEEVIASEYRTGGTQSVVSSLRVTISGAVITIVSPSGSTNMRTSLLVFGRD